MAVETEAKAIPYAIPRTKTSGVLGEKARADLQGLYEKYREWIENADALPQPMRVIAEFVKKEVGMEKPSVEVMHARERYERRAYER